MCNEKGKIKPAEARLDDSKPIEAIMDFVKQSIDQMEEHVSALESLLRKYEKYAGNVSSHQKKVERPHDVVSTH